jgi:hypothetical protein
VASSSAEESKKMYSGTSSVPKVSYGASQGRNQRKVNHEITIESKRKD